MKEAGVTIGTAWGLDEAGAERLFRGKALLYHRDTPAPTA
jgi:hypothetical protein